MSKPYPLVVPDELQQEIRSAARRTGLSMADIMRQSMKLGLPKLREQLSPNPLKSLKPFNFIAFTDNTPPPSKDGYTGYMDPFNLPFTTVCFSDPSVKHLLRCPPDIRTGSISFNKRKNGMIRDIETSIFCCNLAPIYWRSYIRRCHSIFSKMLKRVT